MADVTVEYCVPCGFRDRALSLQRAVLTALERELDSLTLEMGDHGVFRVDVDGEVVYEKDDGDLDPDAVVREIRDRL